VDDPGRTPFGTLLRSMHLSAGLTQEDLGDLAGISARGIRLLEAGQRQTPRLETVRLLAAALRLDEEDARALLHAARPELATAVPRPPLPANALGGAETSMPRGNIPAAIDPLVGRDTIVEAISRRLLDGETRLLTITGSPGIGKTRVALDVARNVAASLPGGAYVVWLAAITDPSLVVPEVYDVVGGHVQRREISLAMLAEAIGDARMLLLLDNMEHVLPAAVAIPDLLGRCPNLTVLTTSRTRLRVTGESQFPLPPLGLRPGHADGQPDSTLRSGAEALFVMRARGPIRRSNRMLGPSASLPRSAAASMGCRSRSSWPRPS
jgi:transcriptional regulator with XRE-family HTH domain